MKRLAQLVLSVVLYSLIARTLLVEPRLVGASSTLQISYSRTWIVRARIVRFIG